MSGLEIALIVVCVVLYLLVDHQRIAWKKAAHRRLEEVEDMLEQFSRLIGEKNKQTEKVEQFTSLLDGLTGMFAVVGISEPAEGFVKYPAGLISSVGDALKRIEELEQGIREVIDVMDHEPAWESLLDLIVDGKRVKGICDIHGGRKDCKTCRWFPSTCDDCGGELYEPKNDQEGD